MLLINKRLSLLKLITLLLNWCQFRPTTKESFTLLNYFIKLGYFWVSLGSWVWDAGSYNLYRYGARTWL